MYFHKHSSIRSKWFIDSPLITISSSQRIHARPSISITVFCWHKFQQWFWSAFLVAFDVFTNIPKVHLPGQWVYRYWDILCTCMVGSFLVGRQSSMIIWPLANVKIWYGIVTLSCKFFNIPSHTSLLTSLIWTKTSANTP